MRFEEIKNKAIEIKNDYDEINKLRGEKRWGSAERLLGLQVDLGELTELVMAKNGFRQAEDLDKKIAHEISDCLWSLIVLADELGVNLETEFIKTMDELKNKIILLKKEVI